MGSFWQSKTKIRLADKKFSLYIRSRDNWHCVYGFKCDRLEDFENNKGGLDCSHFKGRVKESVRFDPQNADAACKKCHAYLDTSEGQEELKEFKFYQLGEKAYKRLLIRAENFQRKDDKMALLMIKELMKTI